MADQNPKKNAGLVELLTALMKGDSNFSTTKNVTPRDVEDLTIAVQTLTTEFTVLAKSIATLAKIVHENSLSINDLFTIQTYILQQVKGTSGDTLLPKVDKNKTNKPN